MHIFTLILHKKMQMPAAPDIKGITLQTAQCTVFMLECRPLGGGFMWSHSKPATPTNNSQLPRLTSNDQQ